MKKVRHPWRNLSRISINSSERRKKEKNNIGKVHGESISLESPSGGRGGRRRRLRRKERDAILKKTRHPFVEEQ